jgi:hypothetical protein
LNFFFIFYIELVSPIATTVIQGRMFLSVHARARNPFSATQKRVLTVDTEAPGTWCYEPLLSFFHPTIRIPLSKERTAYAALFFNEAKAGRRRFHYPCVDNRLQINYKTEIRRFHASLGLLAKENSTFAPVGESPETFPSK